MVAKNLPPLDHLRAFEAAARHLSFKHAAAELHVTPAALGQRIRALEHHLGVALFHRRTRQIVLTPEGQDLLGDVARGLALIRGSVQRLQNRRQDSTLIVSSINSFVELNLMPHLPEFTAQHPDSALRIIATDEHLDPNAGDVDVAIRYGRGHYPGCQSLCFTEDVYIPVAAPALIAQGPVITTPADIAAFPLIATKWAIEQQAAPQWRDWFDAVGLGAQSPDLHRMTVTVEAHAIRAALGAQGIALVHQLQARDAINDGRLVRLLPETPPIPSRFRYCLVWSEARDTALAQAFRTWVIAQFSNP